MKKSIILLLLIGLSFAACITSWNGMPKYVNPEFPGGQGGWSSYIQKNLRYPLKARANKITGRVTLTFAISPEGKVVDAKVVKGLGWGCDEEALRVINNSPVWKPAYKKGKPVRFEFTMPIAFTLTNE